MSSGPGLLGVNSHNSGLQPQSVLYTTLGLTGAPAVAFDPNTISTNGSLAVVGYAFSRDGARLAYGISQGGSDWADWHIRDLANGQDLPDELRWTKYYAPIFAADGKGLYYSAFPAPTPGQELRVRDLNLQPDPPRQNLSAQVKLIASFQKKSPGKSAPPARKTADASSSSDFATVTSIAK
jgi:hypothetical protein